MSKTQSHIQNAQESSSCLSRTSNGIILLMENTFYRLGLLIGKHPWPFMISAFVIACLSSIGLLRFNSENELEKLWIPDSSTLQNDKHFARNRFPSKYRYEIFLIEADNLLSPIAIRSMLDLHLVVKAINVSGNSLDSLCHRIIPTHCMQSSILSIWGYNKAIIYSLTPEKILEAINNPDLKDPILQQPINISKELSGIERDGNNTIVKAKATQMYWILKDQSTPITGNLVNIGSRDEKADLWEDEFIKIGTTQKFEGIKNIYTFAQKSYDDLLSSGLTSDSLRLAIGYSVVLVFVALILGRFNLVQHRILLSLAGLLCIGMAVGFGFGLASAFGLFYGPVHSILPFLLLGIGVDDMFVIVQSLNNLDPESQRKPVPERIALTLKHAGVSITVTSVTDLVAFFIGATTLLPAMSSFCIFAALSVLGLFLFTIIGFSGCLVLDQKRSDENRDAILCCYVHRGYKPNTCSKNKLLEIFIDKFYAPLILSLPMKIFVILTSMGLLGVNIWSSFSLHVNFDSIQYLPPETYAYKYLKCVRNYFPEGSPSAIYIGNISYYEQMDDIETMYVAMFADDYIQSETIDTWLLDGIKDFKKLPEKSEKIFYEVLHGITKIFREDMIVFKNATDPRSGIQGCRIQFKHVNLKAAASSDQIKAMTSVRKIAKNTNFTKIIAYGEHYFNWEAGQILAREFWRNLGIAMAAVFVVTLILIANIWTSFLVFSCVILTLVDLCGTLQFWGSYIEMAVSINVVLAVGLAVDFAAHIGYTFMTIRGTRNERAHYTLTQMGSAVFCGGFSTFLAFILLVTSESYAFQLFFKIYFSVVLFGLFHALAYLPVILSWFGPSPYDSAHDDAKQLINKTNIWVIHNKNNQDWMSKSYEDFQPDIPPPDYTPPMEHHEFSNNDGYFVTPAYINPTFSDMLVQEQFWRQNKLPFEKHLVTAEDLLSY